MRILVLDASRRVVNAIELADGVKYALPAGHSFSPRSDGDIGWTLDARCAWIAIPRPVVPPRARSEIVDDVLTSLGLTPQDIKDVVAR